MHVPISLRARTFAQSESVPTHVQVIPLGEDRYAGQVWWKDPEVSGKIRKIPEVSREEGLEGSGKG